MTLGRVANRYAIAIYDTAAEASRLAELSADFETLQRGLHDSRELLRFFHSPVLPPDVKVKTAKELFHNVLQPHTIEIVLFLIAHRREAIIAEVIEKFFVIQRKKQKVQLAAVTSAVPLGDAQKSTLVDRLRALTKMSVDVRYAVDPALRGGVVVRLDDTVFDGSIAHQLKQMEKRFIEGASA